MPIVYIEELKVYYEKAGSGPPLILLHGLGNNSQSFKNQINNLKEYFTVIVWDAPGYGRSTDMKEYFKNFSQFSNILKELIKKIGYDSVYLMGHSMGAAIAIDFTYNFPEKVKKLILAAPTRGSASLTKKENELNLKNRIQAIDTLSGEELAIQRVPNLLSPNVTADIFKKAKKIMAQVRPSGYKSVAHSLANLNQMNIYPQINKKTLLICGEVDKVTPVSESKIITELIPNSYLKIIPDAGHLCYQEKPEEFNLIVKEFLDK